MNYTETKRIGIRHTCPPYGVVLRWLNPLNNYEVWLFNGKTTRITESGEEVLFAADDERTEEVLKKDGGPVLTLRTMNFTKQQALALSYLFTSPKVTAYIAGEPVAVRVASGTFTTVDELVKRQSLQFDIILPKTNSLTQ